MILTTRRQWLLGAGAADLSGRVSGRLLKGRSGAFQDEAKPWRRHLERSNMPLLVPAVRSS